MMDTVADFPVRPWFLNASFLHPREDKIKTTEEDWRVTGSEKAVPAGSQMRFPPGSGGKGPTSGRRAGAGETERATGGAGGDTEPHPGSQGKRRLPDGEAPARERGQACREAQGQEG